MAEVAECGSEAVTDNCLIRVSARHSPGKQHAASLWKFILTRTLFVLSCLCCLQAELVSTTGDFESYKVRVHNVLKQQKNKATLQSDSEPVKLER